MVTGAETRGDYLARRVNYYPAAVFLDSLPPDARVLFIGEGRRFYVPRDAVAGTPFDRPAIESYSTAVGEQALLESLRADGVTHILVSGPELRRTQNVSADDTLRRYFPSGSLRLLFEAHDVRVYELP